MITIKILTKQDYEKNSKSPSEFIFYSSEKELCKIISTYLTETIEENLKVLEKFLHLPKAEVYETEFKEKVLYIIE